MAKQNKRNWKQFFFLSELKEETKHWISSILSFVLAIFFFLAYWDTAGIVGETVKKIFVRLFGVGYFLFPLFLIGFSATVFSANRPQFIAAALSGGILFLTAGFALLDIVIKESGGVIGHFLSSPLVSFFDTFAAKIILIGVLSVSLLIFFDATPKKIISAIVSFIKRLGERFGKKDTAALDSNVLIGNSVTDNIYKENKKTETDDTAENINKKEAQSAQKKDGIISHIAQKISGTGKNMEPFLGINFLKSKKYSPPPFSLLETDKGKPGVGDIKANANIIKRTLQNFGINVLMDEVSVGPSFTRYALKPAQGIKLSRIVGLQNDLSLALAAHPLRIEAPIPGKSLVGIEIPNSKKTTVGLGSLLTSEEVRNAAAPLIFPIGRSIAGGAMVGDLNKMPHLLIAGATGSGKSVSIHTIITSLLYRNSPAHLRFIMVDPKRVELTLYNNIPHLLTPVITDPKKAILSLKWAAKEMDRRYDILESEAVRDIGSYHKNIVDTAYKKQQESGAKDNGTDSQPLPEILPYIVIIIDELADIMSTYPRELESAIIRIAQMSRAVGIHLVLSTQRPQVNIITGLIKANIPARIALQVSSQTDSRTILDMGGAEKLLGSGDMLYISGDMSKPMRLQSAYIGEPEIKKVVTFLSEHNKSEEFGTDISVTSPAKDALFEITLEEDLEHEEEGGDDDDLYEEAREIVIHSKKASTTYLQRKLKIGYARAARIMDILEERGIIGPGEGAKPRDVLISSDEAIDGEYTRSEDNNEFRNS